MDFPTPSYFLSEEVSPTPSYLRLEVVPACGPHGGGLELLGAARRISARRGNKNLHLRFMILYVVFFDPPVNKVQYTSTRLLSICLAL